MISAAPVYFRMLERSGAIFHRPSFSWISRYRSKERYNSPANKILLEEEEIAVFYKGRFTIEDWFGPFEGWTTGQRWNGWECPYFEFDTAIRMVRARPRLMLTFLWHRSLRRVMTWIVSTSRRAPRLWASSSM